MIPQELRESLSEHCSHYASRRVGLIYVLQKLQEHYDGSLPDTALAEAAEIVGIDEAEIESVATFFNWLFRKPVGRTVIACCDSISCYLGGCYQNIAHLENRLGIKMGETSPDGEWTLLPVVCLGNCDHAPTMLIGDKLYDGMTPEKIDKALDEIESKRRAESR